MSTGGLNQHDLTPCILWIYGLVSKTRAFQRKLPLELLHGVPASLHRFLLWWIVMIYPACIDSEEEKFWFSVELMGCQYFFFAFVIYLSTLELTRFLGRNRGESGTILPICSFSTGSPQVPEAVWASPSSLLLGTVVVVDVAFVHSQWPQLLLVCLEPQNRFLYE